MFNRRAAFIIGAGANEQFGFPLGRTLLANIRDMIGGDDQPSLRLLIEAAIVSGEFGERDLWTAARAMRAQMEFDESIDDFLHRMRESPAIVRLGKLAIARAILLAERASDLFRVSRGEKLITEISAPENWLFKLTKMLVKNCTPENADALFENVDFITFNYDRSLELYLVHAVSRACGLSLDEAERIVFKKARIFHAYGVLGNLPSPINSLGVVPFGVDLRGRELFTVADRIKTYTESFHDDDLANIREAMHSALQVVFLGCGYHDQNIDLIRPTSGMMALRLIGTIFGVTPNNELAIHQRLNGLFVGGKFFDKYNLERMNCSQVIDEYALSLPNF